MDLTIREAGVLRIVSAEGRVNVRGLIRKGTSPKNLKAILGGLERKGLLRREVERSYHFYRISARGAHLLASSQRDRAIGYAIESVKMLRELTKMQMNRPGATAEELARLQNLLEAICANIADLTPRGKATVVFGPKPDHLVRINQRETAKS